MSSLFDQWLGAAPQSLSQTQDNPGNYTKYQGGIPNSSPIILPEDATVPYWDTPPEALYPSDPNGFDPWDTIYFAGKRFPGIARVRTKKSRRVDVKEPRGQDGATMTSTGYKPAEIDITLSIWTQDQLSQLQKQMQIILPAAGAKGTITAVTVYYPALAVLGIGSIFIFDVDALEPSSPKGMWSMKIHCREWAAAANGAATVTTTPANAVELSGVQTAINQGDAANQAKSNLDPAKDSTGPRLRLGSNFTGT